MRDARQDPREDQDPDQVVSAWMVAYILYSRHLNEDRSRGRGSGARQLMDGSAQLCETLTLPTPTTRHPPPNWGPIGGAGIGCPRVPSCWCVTATKGCTATGERVGVPAKTGGLAIYCAGLWSPGAGRRRSGVPGSLAAAAGIAYFEGKVCFFSYVSYAMLSKSLACLPAAVPLHDGFRRNSTSQAIHLNIYF